MHPEQSPHTYILYSSPAISPCMVTEVVRSFEVNLLAFGEEHPTSHSLASRPTQAKEHTYPDANFAQIAQRPHNSRHLGVVAMAVSTLLTMNGLKFTKSVVVWLAAFALLS